MEVGFCDEEKMLKIAAIILTKNEEKHLERCLMSISGLVQEVFIVDSGSTDCTEKIAKKNNAKFFANHWTNYATQFNWAIEKVTRLSDCDWVLRIDADEALSEGLAKSLKEIFSKPQLDASGIIIDRRMCFLGQPIRFGGVFPSKVVRLFKLGYGYCEQRWMDEHIIVNGRTISAKGEILDDNQNTLTWWTDKHNAYSSREAVDVLNLKYKFLNYDVPFKVGGSSQAIRKRWLKEHIYARTPSNIRAFLYFTYRYCFRLGFLDGRVGFAFHFLQGFWYRYLVDEKVEEVERAINQQGMQVEEAIYQVLAIDVTSTPDN
jgi:glycosyltransferase involved in cell wall biosynthesis